MKNAARILFIYTLLVILWGAWVRISHSGDGCGDSWPLCQGQFVPGTGEVAAHAKTWVEYTHRLMSGFYGVFVFALWFLILRRFPKGHDARKAAHAVLFFTVTEALLGAKLVIFGLVSQNASWVRTTVMSLHQMNSMLLSGTAALLALSLSSSGFRWKPRSSFVTILFLAIAVTGAWAALASTLFPSETLWEGIMKDFAPGSHHLLRLRVLHPLSALLGGGGLAAALWMKGFEDGPDKSLHQQTALMIFGAIIFGVLTLFFLSPLWMKITHLAIAHLVWAGLLRWAFVTHAPRTVKAA
ncbi:MAG TPA: COX15/CtaA family protein [Pseudobdellovibrionaceae bacterium]|nr:COX15/CtaA family protein [Pseudobdellovibrionaceae bacterium]